jgi:type I restriction enzyme S subunit
MVPYLRAANVKDGSLDLTDVKSMDFGPSEQSIFGLRPGDVLVSEGAGSLAAVGASAVFSGEIEGAVCFQNTLLRLRPRSGTDPGYLMWWARHAYGSGLFASIAEGANIYHLGAENVRVLPITVPHFRSQRAIAGYLDAEAARIDAVVALRRRQLDALEWKRVHFVVSRVAPLASAPGSTMASSFPGSWQVTRLKFLTELPVAGDWGDDPTGDSAVAVVRAADFDRQHWRVFESRPPERAIASDSFAERALRAGDLVIEKSGGGPEQPVGAVVMFDLEAPAVPSNFAARLRALPDVDARYLCFIFAAAYALGLNEKAIKQTTGIQNLDLGAYLSEAWAIPPREIQIELRVQIEEALASIDACSTAIQQQISLLLERRQALITAAVTGQLEIAGVAT